jgi:hypothetical protein
MRIEEWKNFSDNKNKNRRRSQKEEVNSGRRKFLKLMGASGVALAGASVVKKLDNIFDWLDEDEKKEEVKKVEEIEEEDESSHVERRELKGAEKIAQEILDTFNLPAMRRRIDSEVFTKDFYMAQQFQESRGEKEAESKAGARGVYQNKPVSVMEVVEYLDFLRDKTADSPVDEKIDYLGPESLNREEAEEVSKWFTKVANYGRATGKLYLQSIHDPEYKYNNGKPNKDIFRGKSAREQQKRLLVAYHDGPAQRVNPSGASENGKNYVKYVFKHMETIEDLRTRLEKAGMSPDLDYAILKIMRELERKENKNTKENPKRREEVINFWLKKLQDSHMALWRKTGDVDDRISNREIRAVFSK